MQDAASRSGCASGRAEHIPFDDDRFDAALAQLVLHFVSDPPAAAAEMARTVRPGGLVGACVWDFANGMEMLRHFWDAASTLNPDAPDEARTLRFGAPGEIVALFEGAGLLSVEETSLAVQSSYRRLRRDVVRLLGGDRSGRCVHDVTGRRTTTATATGPVSPDRRARWTVLASATARCAIGRVRG